jgi:hypothetical protein
LTGRSTTTRRIDGGGYTRELALFLMVIASAVTAVLAILKPRPTGDRPGRQ